MAHPALWGIGGLAVALVAAGIWLNRSAPSTAVAPAERAAEPAAEPAAVAGHLLPPPRPTEGAAASAPAAAAAPAADPHNLLPPPRPADGASAPAPAPAAVADPHNLLPPPRPAEAAAPLPEEAAPGGRTGGMLSRVGPGDAPVLNVVRGDDAAPDGPAPAAPSAAPEAQPDAPEAEGEAGDAAGDESLIPASRLASYGGAPEWRLDLPDGLDEAQQRMILSVLGSRHGAAPYFGAAAFSPDSGAFGIISGYGTLAAAEAAALDRCQGACAIVARLVPEDFDGRRSDTLNAAQAEARAELDRAAAAQGGRSVLYHVLAWSDEGALGTARLGTPEGARTLALLDCRTQQRRITGAGDDAPPCRAALVAAPTTSP